MNLRMYFSFVLVGKILKVLDCHMNLYNFLRDISFYFLKLKINVLVFV